MGAFWASTPGAGFAHGKAILFETDVGPFVCLGSANPTGAGWLGGEHSNAEANVLLTGTVAAKAVTELGLDMLLGASLISAETLQSVAARSLEQRERERARDATTNSTPVIVGVRQGDAITVAGLDLKDCLSVVALQGTIEFRSANFTATEGGLVFTTEPPLREGARPHRQRGGA